MKNTEKINNDQQTNNLIGIKLCLNCRWRMYYDDDE